MKFTKLLSFFLVSITLFIFGCKDNEPEVQEPKLIFKFKFDKTQQRLNNLGLPSTLPSNHAGQSPDFNVLSAHYLELAPNMYTALGGGSVLYHAPETTQGGATAIDFSKSIFAKNGETFFSIPIKDVTPGIYEWLRVSLAYQNYDVKMYINQYQSYTINQEFSATIASFVGYNTFINNFKIKNQEVAVNDDKLQGFWGFETNVNAFGINYPYYSTGQAPAGATTVPNPIFATSPIPAGSCVVTAAFANSQKLEIQGNETKDIIVEVSISVNQSFEWVEVNADGKWEPLAGENIVDMGVRGMIPTIQ